MASLPQSSSPPRGPACGNGVDGAGALSALLTVKEAAVTLRCSPRRVFELLADGTLTRGVKFGRETVVVAESVFAALEAEYHPPAPPRVRTPKPAQSFTARMDAFAADRKARRRG